MTVKFVFSSVPVGTMPASCKTIPIAPKEHDHHFQVELEHFALESMLKQQDFGAIELLFISAAYKALKSAVHDSSFLYATIIGHGSSSPSVAFSDDASMHQAVSKSVKKAIDMAKIYCDIK